MLITLEVLKLDKSKEVKDVQEPNIPDISITFLVSNFVVSISIKEDNP